MKRFINDEDTFLSSFNLTLPFFRVGDNSGLIWTTEISLQSEERDLAID